MEEQQFRQGEVTSKISGRLIAKATSIINLVFDVQFCVRVSRSTLYNKGELALLYLII